MSCSSAIVGKERAILTTTRSRGRPLRSGCCGHPEKEWVWVDYCSLPQDVKNDEGHVVKVMGAEDKAYFRHGPRSHQPTRTFSAMSSCTIKITRRVSGASMKRSWRRTPLSMERSHKLNVERRRYVTTWCSWECPRRKMHAFKIGKRKRLWDYWGCRKCRWSSWTAAGVRHPRHQRK